ncbi:RNA polymerase sigma factor ShbA [Saccharothrix coeruleofusca]|uniref:RNA polymerase sigma-D factor n=1 Tax=Saccharothrix coeruleofusca TaxID=33919 RepID=A0A918AU22_9PSEU|nr:RNA polymerase sigma factor ShbA [Saccharothrix coeruleofusca]GGP85730.1 putative RNA polymerase sigma-D factor [Saccharothrix coeruleofusca]
MTAHVEPDAHLDVLARSAVEGDRKATDELLVRLKPLVVRYCRGRIGGGTFASADDVAQDALIGVFKALPDYRDEGRGFLAFVFGIARRKIADYYRKAGRERATPVAELPDRADDRGGPEQAALHNEGQRNVHELLGVLSDTQREVLMHRLVIGLSSDETAEALSMTPGAVRVAQHRALRKLRDRLTGGREAA